MQPLDRDVGVTDFQGNCVNTFGFLDGDDLVVTGDRENLDVVEANVAVSERVFGRDVADDPATDLIGARVVDDRLGDDHVGVGLHLGLDVKRDDRLECRSRCLG